MINVFLLISILLCPHARCISQDLNEDIKIFKNSISMRDVGYSDCEPTTNGEYLVLNHFLKDDSIVFDVGAAQGEWSRQAFSEKKNITIYAFEPIAEHAEELSRQFSSHLMNVYNLALGSKKEVSNFYFCPEMSVLSGLHFRSILSEQFSFSSSIREVQVDTIDSIANQLGLKHIDFLKIDTEGNELAVIRGASIFLQNKAVRVIQFEYGACYRDSKTTLREVYNLLQAYNYSVFRITSDGLIYINEWKEELENYNYSNYLALPIAE